MCKRRIYQGRSDAFKYGRVPAPYTSLWASSSRFGLLDMKIGKYALHISVLSSTILEYAELYRKMGTHLNWMYLLCPSSCLSSANSLRRSSTSQTWFSTPNSTVACVTILMFKATSRYPANEFESRLSSSRFFTRHTQTFKSRSRVSVTRHTQTFKSRRQVCLQVDSSRGASKHSRIDSEKRHSKQTFSRFAEVSLQPSKLQTSSFQSLYVRESKAEKVRRSHHLVILLNRRNARRQIFKILEND